MADVQNILILVAAAFVPAFVFLVYIRNQETAGREPWGVIFRVFLFGAVFSVIIALILETVFNTGQEREYVILEKTRFTVPAIVFLVVVIAPLAEEFAKGLGVRGAKKFITEEEDGIIYGAAAGFGFAATENLFYELAALQAGGSSGFIATAVVRTITGNFLHATTTGILGYGIGRRYRERRSIVSLIPYFLAAVAVHASFNLIAVAGIGPAVILTIIFAFFAMRFTVRRIRRLDEVPTFTPLGPR